MARRFVRLALAFPSAWGPLSEAPAEHPCWRKIASWSAGTLGKERPQMQDRATWLQMMFFDTPEARRRNLVGPPLSFTHEAGE